MSTFFFWVTVQVNGETEVISGRLSEIDMLAATEKLETLYPSAIKFEIHKYNCKVAIPC